MLLAASATCGQEFLWDVEFASQFDNREYNSAFAVSQTLFGARLTPEIGFGWGQERANGLKAGATVILEFGAPNFERRPGEMVLYYDYNTEQVNISGGIFPRSRTIGRYSRAFFSDSVRMYDANISGLLAQVRGDRGYFEFACDWDSRQSETRREKFTLFSAAEARYGVGFAGYSLSMHHHAGSMLVDGVVDNIWVEPYLGVDLAQRFDFDVLRLQAGWLQSFQNNRKWVGSYVKPGGVEIGLQVQRWGFGLDNTLYLDPSYDRNAALPTYVDDGATYTGGGLMPYYGPYGGGLYCGDPFYRTTNGIYDRLELYWEPIARRDMSLRVSSVHHYDGRGNGWQQMVSFRAAIGRSDFERRPRKGFRTLF